MAATRPSAARAAVDRSFEELYRGHRADVFRAALRELGNVHEAEDVTQAAFMDAYRAVLRGSEPQSPRAWLLAIAENVRRRRHRTALRRPREEPTDADFPLTAELPHEHARSLAGAMADLPQEQRRVFVLREIVGLSYEEIAQETESTVAAIQMQLFRARRSLRERLDPPTVSRRRTGLLPLPGWLTALSRPDLTLLTPRAAGAVGAAAAAVVGATVAVNEAAPPVPHATAQPRPAVVSSAPAADPVAIRTARRPLALARAQVAAPPARATVAVPTPGRTTKTPVGDAPVPVAPAAPEVTPTATPAVAPAAVEPVVAEARPTAVAAAAEPAVRAAGEQVEQVLEPPRLPVPISAVEAEPVLEAPVAPPLSTAPVTEVVTGAARAAGGGAQPLPVPGAPPVTVPPAP